MRFLFAKSPNKLVSKFVFRSILITIMIPNLFTRPATTWVTIVVIVLHGAVAWAMVSVDKPAPIVIKNSPKVIHLELITLDAAPQNTLSSTKALSTKAISAKPQIRANLENPSPSTVQLIALIDKVEITKTLPVSELVEPLKTKVEQKQTTPIKSAALVKEDSNVEQESDNLSSDQKLTIVESRRIMSTSKKTEETEDDLSAMIRAVTAQFNREQTVQQRAAKNQANKKLIEQEQWKLQATTEAVSQMLALAAEQAEKQVSDQVDLVEGVDKNNKEVTFSADEGSWLEAHEPITSIPALVWRSVNSGLGDVFIVILELHVDKKGYITEVQVLESSTSPIIDAIATAQVRAGQLNPLIQNGMAVAGIVPMSLVYERP